MNAIRNGLVMLLSVWTVSATAELSFAPILNDGAVLQCEMPVNIWGKADPGASVTVTFAGQTKSAEASESGKWQVVLDPMSSTSEPRSLQVSSFEFQVSLSNVVVGEVWLATGQSNMVMPLRNSTGGEERLNMTIPAIRFAKVPQQTGLPPEPMNAEQLKWKSFAPPANQEIAAVAFYFAEYLQKHVGGTIGIIQNSYGGTPCEAWTPAWALDAQPQLKPLADAIRKGVASGKAKEQWQAEAAGFMEYWRARRDWAKDKKGPAPTPVPQPGPDNPWDSKSPTVLYENMIKPLIPYTARGIIWYQGESNAGKPDEYRVLFPAMIEAWRKEWKRPDWPFFFVQLSAFNHPNQDWPGLRAAQSFARDTVPATGMAVAIDCGDKENIHPEAKQPVGERLALLALAEVYGRKMVSRGPSVASVTAAKGGRVRVAFNHAEKGLATRDGQPDVPGFEVAGADGRFLPVPARVVAKDTVELACDGIADPGSVRYAWASWVEPPVTLQNSAGLPAEPFIQQINKSGE